MKKNYVAIYVIVMSIVISILSCIIIGVNIGSMFDISFHGKDVFWILMIPTYISMVVLNTARYYNNQLIKEYYMRIIYTILGVLVMSAIIGFFTSVKFACIIGGIYIISFIILLTCPVIIHNLERG